MSGLGCLTPISARQTFITPENIKTNTPEDIKSHFSWCIEKVIKNFKEENIIFDNTEELKEYFFNFYMELFYKFNDKEGGLEKLFLEIKIKPTE